MVKRGVMILCVLTVFLTVFVSAGVGIKWETESILAAPGDLPCITYKVYNPWPEDSNVVIGLSGELSGILDVQETESKFVPANTASGNALPIEFCFEVPSVYEEDCLVGSFICEQKCGQEMKVFEGEVIVSTVPGGSGSGSATKASVSAPLRVKVLCEERGRNYTAIYVLVALIALIAILIIIKGKFSKKKKVKKGKR